MQLTIFCTIQKNMQEFEHLIANVGSYQLPEKYNKEEILEFYYMHYLYFSPKYNFQNSIAFKDFNQGEIYLPDDCMMEDLIYN
jgi:hypothetical protein